MADKETDEELARKKKAEAEIFAKTMGFTHTPSPEELERTVVLNPSRPAPDKTPDATTEESPDFESTVRFSNFDALVESTISTDSEQTTGGKPPVEERPSPSAVDAVSEKPVPEAPPKQTAPIPPASKELDLNDDELELPASDTTFTPEIPPAAPAGGEDRDPEFDLDFADAALDSAPPSVGETDGETGFDSDAALDELDELLKMDIPDAGTETSAETPARAADDDLSLPEQENEIPAMETVQLGADDMVTEEAPAQDDQHERDDEFLFDVPPADDVEDKNAKPDSLTEMMDNRPVAEEETESFATFTAPVDTDKAASIPPEEEMRTADEKVTAEEPESFREPEPAAEVDAIVPSPPAGQGEAVAEKRGGSGLAIFLSLVAITGAAASYLLSQAKDGDSGRMLADVTQNSAAIGNLRTENRRLSETVANLTEKVDTLEQQLADLTRVIASRAAARKKAESHAVIRPSTPVKPVARKIKKAASAAVTKGWVINLTSVSSAESARQELARLKQLGVDAESIRTEARGKTWYRIRVGGFDSLQEAETQSRVLADRLGIRDIWVGRP